MCEKKLTQNCCIRKQREHNWPFVKPLPSNDQNKNIKCPIINMQDRFIDWALKVNCSGQTVLCLVLLSSVDWTFCLCFCFFIDCFCNAVCYKYVFLHFFLSSFFFTTTAVLSVKRWPIQFSTGPPKIQFLLTSASWTITVISLDERLSGWSTAEEVVQIGGPSL